MLPNPWGDLARFRRAVAYCDEFAERLLGPLASYLNAASGTAHETRYWRILFGCWLRYHIQTMYEHHAVVQDAFTAFPALKTVRLDPASFQTPQDGADYLRLAQTDRYQFQMFSEFVPAHGRFPARRLDEDERPNPLPRRSNRLKDSIKAAVSRLLAFSARAGLGEILICDLSLTGKEQRALLLRSRFQVRTFFAEFPARARSQPVWDERRNGLAKVMEGRDEFERLLIASLPRYFPPLYLEGYRAAREFCRSRLGPAPRVVFSATGWFSNEPFKFAAADFAEKGSALWGFQHGGVYGLWEHAEGERMERSIVDRYYCWGWSALSGDPGLKDLPHPQLSRVGDKRPGDDILFVPIFLFLHKSRFDRLGYEQGIDYIDRQARFLRALPDRLRKKAAVRFFYELGWSHESRLRELVPGIRGDDSARPFPERLSKARLAVFDCPMTTFLEALAADVPSILTWSPDAWVFRPEAQPYFDRLKRAGILHDRPEDAARLAAEIYDDPRAWWDSAEVRMARQAFAETFALSREDWLERWREEFRQAGAGR